MASGHLTQAVRQQCPDLGRARREVLFPDRSQHRPTGARRHGIPRRGLDGERRRHIQDRGRPDHRRQRQAAPESLPERHHVRRDLLGLERVEESRPAQPHLDLVADEKDPVAPASLLQAAQEPVGRHDHPAVGLDRLQEQRGHLPRWDLGPEQPVEMVEDLPPGIRRRAPVRIRIGELDQARPGRRVRLRRMPGDGHGARGAAVVGADERDEPGPARGGLDRPHGGLVGVRSRVAEPHLSLGRPGRGGEEVLGQRDGRLVDRGQHAGRGHVRRRSRDRFHHGRMPVPEAGRAPGRREVQQPPAVFRDQIRALSARDEEREEPELLDAGDDALVAPAQVHDESG